MKRYAVADEVPEDCDYLTAGREYLVVWSSAKYPHVAIEDDAGDLLCVFLDSCVFLNGKSWRIVERE